MAQHGKYRWRTALRVRLPWRPPLYQLVPKGRHDCGDHEWYRVDDRTAACYHCVVGRRTLASGERVGKDAAIKAPLDVAAEPLPDVSTRERTGVALSQ